MNMIKWEFIKLRKRKKIRNTIIILTLLILFTFWITHLTPEVLKEEIKTREQRLKELVNKLEKTKDEKEVLYLKSHIREIEDELSGLYEFVGKVKRDNWQKETKEYIRKLENELKNLKEDYSFTLSRENYRILIDTNRHYLEKNIPPGERKNMPLIIIFGMLINNLGNIIFPLIFIYLIAESISFEKENDGLLWILQTKNGRNIRYVFYKYITLIITGVGITLLIESLSLIILSFIYKPRWDIPFYMFTKYNLIDGEIIPIYGSTLKISPFIGVIYFFLYHSLYLISISTIFYLISVLSSTTSQSYFFSLLIVIMSIVIEVVDKTKKISVWLPFSHFDVTEPFSLRNSLVLQTKNPLFQFPFPVLILGVWILLSLLLTIIIFSRKTQKNWSITKE